MAFVFCLLAGAGTVYAEKAYQITETELTQLENTIERQLIIIGRLQSEAQLLRRSESELRESLLRASEELRKMKVELLLLRQDLASSGKALESANRSLHEYEKEMKRKVQVIRWQRGFAYALFAGSMVYMAAK